MVQSLLAGTKTQTRRALKFQPFELLLPRDKRAQSLASVTRQHDGRRFWYALTSREPAHGKAFRCRYGEVGDSIWVRETWLPRGNNTAAFYRADYDAENAAGLAGMYSDRGWRSPIYMPRWASRLTLTLTSVRIERLQDISEADAKAEGARRFEDLPSRHPFGQDDRWSMESPTATDQCLGSARFAFANYWNKINGTDSWESDPFVWVLQFHLAGRMEAEKRGARDAVEDG
jgi:hypothetical protein